MESNKLIYVIMNDDYGQPVQAFENEEKAKAIFKEYQASENGDDYSLEKCYLVK